MVLSPFSNNKVIATTDRDEICKVVAVKAESLPESRYHGKIEKALGSAQSKVVHVVVISESKCVGTSAF